ALERERLWSEAETAERQWNSRVGREYLVALPCEISAPGRTELARSISQHIADRFSVAVDLAVHTPRPQGDPRNHHAHLLTTTRRVESSGLGAKSDIELPTYRRFERGLPKASREIWSIREHWATLVNEALKEQGLDVRIDHRSLKEQGIDREPVRTIPYAVIAMERAGIRTEVMGRDRQYAEDRRVHVGQMRGLELEAAANARSQRVVAENLDLERAAREALLGANGTPAIAPRPVYDLAAADREALRRWREYREANERTGRDLRLEKGVDAKVEREHDRSRDKADDLGL
ncbi:MAG TPA: MobA/MobL family protein, partial [Steroidobacteraceae bacterium]|nr:MobA/MobL family protein [Steroidobacteraceae bacterium]